jgi:two-component system phosphate regulon sensor histidine kinase PhoR
MASFWQGPLTSLAFIGFLALVTKLVLGTEAALVVVALGLFMLLAAHLIRHAALSRWLNDPASTPMPQGGGIWEETFAALYRMVKRQRKSEADLTERLERFRQAAAAMPDGVVILDPQGVIQWCNPMAEKHFGLDPQHDIGQQITYLVRQPDFAAFLTTPNYREPFVLKGYRSSEQTLSVQLIPYGDEQKLIMSRDVSRWERIEMMRRDFVANVSHELRTPLTVVGGFLETLTDLEGAEPAVVRRSLQLMTEQTQRMQRLVEDLLALTRLESNQRPPSGERVNMPLLIQSLVADAQHLSRGRHQIALKEHDANCLTGAEDELRSAFGNLLSNAVRYTPEGGSIQVRWRIVNGEGIFSVTDAGVGIAPEHIPRLTERFYRIDRSRSRETGGTGLGLAIVKHVLSRHQARLEVQSELGKGSTFSAIFPPARVAPPAAARNAPADSAHA